MKTLIIALSFATAAAAQTPTTGTFHYRVDGVYEGETMEPWSATVTVAASGDGSSVMVTVDRGPGVRFEYSYNAGRDAHWINEGRSGTNNCATPVKDEVPDFALATTVATLADGPHELKMLSCTRTGVVTRVVKFVTTRDGDSIDVKGADDYPFEVKASKDGRVLRFVQPQGIVGQAIYRLQ